MAAPTVMCRRSGPSTSSKMAEVEGYPLLSEESREALELFPGAGAFALIFTGALFGGALWMFGHDLLGPYFLAQGLLLAVILVMTRRPIAHRSTWMLAVVTAFTLHLTLCFAAPTLAALSRWLPSPLAVGASLLFLGGIWLQGRYYYRAHLVAWEAHRNHNERHVLDLNAGTYAFKPGFKERDVEMPKWELWAMWPVLFIGSMGTYVLSSQVLQYGGLDVAILVWGVIGMIAAPMMTRMVAQTAVRLVKLREYERRLGRPIYNR